MPFPKLDKIAVILPAYCQKTGKMFGIRTEQISTNNWLQTWAFKMDENIMQNEKLIEKKINGHIAFAPEYNGCPYCGSRGWFECNKCHNIICCDDSPTATCPKCGNKIESFVEGSAWNLDGGEH